MNGFGNGTTTDEVLSGLDLTGRRYLVTGANSGLGTETVRALTAHGAHVTAAVRDPDAARDVLDPLLGNRPEALDTVRIDLGDLTSVRAAAAELLDRGGRFDGVCNNAGLASTPPGTTVDGFETQFGTNHVGHFVFVARLLPLLLDGPPVRVVNVSSAAHRLAAVDLDDPNWERTPYEKWAAYGASKSANILHAVELTRRYADRGLVANAVHPGGISTRLGRHLVPGDREAIPDIMRRTGEAAYKSLEAGTATQVWALTHPSLEGVGGRYLLDCSIGEEYEHPEAIGGHAPWALDADAARRLWTISEELTGESVS
ncbi:MAG: SDR family NAD(P)-dependent oxidoreductase [Actinomycetota bacterium]